MDSMIIRFPISVRISSVLLFLLCIMAVHAREHRPQPDKKPLSARVVLDRYMDTIVHGLPEKVRGALARIPDKRRRLAAMKYYLRRSEQEIERKWAWTSEEARIYRTSPEYYRAMAEIATVKQSFARLNPGYQLAVDMEIRSLGNQIGKWNSVRSIGLVAEDLMTASLAFIADSITAQDSGATDTGLNRFIPFLRDFEPKHVPTVAVPGLSQHGQLRAFDFRVMRGGRVVAGASTRTITSAWDRAGWTVRLCEAIEAASGRFEGPLAEPYEPWHYEYRP